MDLELRSAGRELSDLEHAGYLNRQLVNQNR